MRMRINLPVPAATIWDVIKPFSGGRYQSPSWDECLAYARRSSAPMVIGEAILVGDAREEDFALVPNGRYLRVVMLQTSNGYQLRWSDHIDMDRLKRLLNGIYHSDMLRAADFGIPARSGWMIITTHDCLELS
jgi:hypothetical protein